MMKNAVEDKVVHLKKTKRGIMELTKEPKITRKIGIFKLNNWTAYQQNLYKKGNLENNKQSLLEKINNWFWNN